jgi:hypothetical protein
LVQVTKEVADAGRTAEAGAIRTEDGRRRIERAVLVRGGRHTACACYTGALGKRRAEDGGRRIERTATVGGGRHTACACYTEALGETECPRGLHSELYGVAAAGAWGRWVGH